MRLPVLSCIPGKRCFLTLACITFFAPLAFGESDKETLERLERNVQQQQAQIEELQKQVEALSRRSEKEPAEAADSTRAAAPKESEAPPVMAPNKSDKMRLELYGQVNRAMLYTQDGNEGNFYHVDNDNSYTRIGFEAKAKATGDVTVGAKVEAEIQSNDSDKVNQEDKNGVGDSFFRKRHLDVYLTSNRFGKLFVGHGGTASDRKIGSQTTPSALKVISILVSCSRC